MLYQDCGEDCAGTRSVPKLDDEPPHIQFLKGFLDPQSIRRYDLVSKSQVERLLGLMEDYFLDKIPPEEFLSQFASEIHGVKLWLKEIQRSEFKKGEIKEMSR